MYKKIKLVKSNFKTDKIKNRIINFILFLLILLLTIATMIAIRIRSEKQNYELTSNYVEQTEETTYNETANNTPYEKTDSVNLSEKQTKRFVYPNSGKTIKEFSDTNLIYSKTMDDWRIHCGIDICTTDNSKVYAIYDGNISEILKDDIYGTTILIEHKDGIISKYSNINPKNEITINHKVYSGEYIGDVIDNPICESDEELHLHFEIYKDGIHIDPIKFLNNKIISEDD